MVNEQMDLERRQFLMGHRQSASCRVSKPPFGPCRFQNPKPLLVNQESIKMATKIEQFSYADKVAALTHQYLELGSATELSTSSGRDGSLGA